MKVQVLNGGKHVDSRGRLDHVNDFDMSEVKRMYLITHIDPSVKRGWRAHKLEQRWFYVVEGSFEVSLVKIDDWVNPNPDLQLEVYVLSADKPQVLHVPVGYATGFKALERDAKFIVYADFGIENAVNDNYQYPSDYFTNWK
ncbi:WxcM-like domain-containing protein [Pedobacter panaciterrae]|uniref:WxcM-like domain-containing protein n=1 Tax=Pedobacter panaciterrae TaxID=363849 RepID=A0ABU8NTQ5_9SPHI